MGSSGSKLDPNALQEVALVNGYSKSQAKDVYKGLVKKYPAGYMTEEDVTEIWHLGYLHNYPGGELRGLSRLLFKGYEGKQRDRLSFLEYLTQRGNNSANKEVQERVLIWSFRVYDRKRTGKITYKDILPVQEEVFKMFTSPYRVSSGEPGPAYLKGKRYVECLLNYSSLPPDESTPELRIQKAFKLLSKDYQVDSIDLDEFRKLKELGGKLVL